MAMRAKMTVQIVGREKVKEREAGTFNGRSFKAKPEHWLLHVLIGEFSKKFPTLFKEQPQLVKVEIPKLEFNKTTTQAQLIAEVRERKGTYSILALEGYNPILSKRDEEETDNEEEEEDEE